MDRSIPSHNNNFFFLFSILSNIYLFENENKSTENSQIRHTHARFLSACFESFKTFTPLSSLLFPNVYRGKIIRAGDGNNENVRARNNAASIHARYSPLETRATPRAASASLTNLCARLIKKIIAVIPEDEISRISRKRNRPAAFSTDRS